MAVFDATNTTRKRRAAVIARCTERSHALTVTFCESICDDKTVLDGNLRCKAANSPDYRHMPIEEVCIHPYTIYHIPYDYHPRMII